MKKYAKLFAGIVCALAIATSAFAAGTNTVKNTSLFNSGEYGLSLSTGYTVDRAAAFQSPYALNGSAGVFVFPTRNLGFEANVPFYSTKGVSVDEVQAGALFRLPLSKSTPVLRNISPYVGLGGAYNWQEQSKFSFIAKAGAEFRVNAGWGVFAEYQYRNNSLQDPTANGQSKLQGGVKFVF